MSIINNPTERAFDDTMHHNDLELTELPIQADAASVAQYCSERSYSLDSYSQDNQHFSNDGARLYNYYDTVSGQWLNAWGYSAIVTEIVYN